MLPFDWTSACVVPFYKGKGDRCEYTSFRDISLLSVLGDVYGKVLIKRIREYRSGFYKEQSVFRRGRSYVDQVFAVRKVSKKSLAKGKVVFCGLWCRLQTAK